MDELPLTDAPPLNKWYNELIIEGATMTLTRESIFQVLRENKERLTEKYGLTKLGLFGSFARGTAAEDSDIDICFDTASMQPFAATHIKEEFESLLHRSVDIVQPHPFMRILFLQRLEKEVIYV